MIIKNVKKTGRKQLSGSGFAVERRRTDRSRVLMREDVQRQMRMRVRTRHLQNFTKIQTTNPKTSEKETSFYLSTQVCVLLPKVMRDTMSVSPSFA